MQSSRLKFCPPVYSLHALSAIFTLWYLRGKLSQLYDPDKNVRYTFSGCDPLAHSETDSLQINHSRNEAL